MEVETHLVCELPGVADDESRYFLVHRLKLLKDGQHEHCGLPHPRLCLTDHIHAKDGLWDALMLHCASTAKDINGASLLRMRAEDCGKAAWRNADLPVN